MKILLLIGTGSFIGGVCRYLLSQWIQPKSLGTFPVGTLIVNLTGCLVIGIIFGIAEKGNISNEMKLFFATGLLGGFTTFSAFSNETFTLLNAGHYSQAIMYVLASVLIGLLATFLGFVIISKSL
ncbi:MAG TPA: fluoride efflux transporter CrcB [Saprospiraceae bacterium]|nr:fluoride efflux transporter CrcB [Saprospiraceae bacterium]